MEKQEQVKKFLKTKGIEGLQAETISKWFVEFLSLTSPNQEAKVKEDDVGKIAIGFAEWASDNKWIKVIGSDSWFLYPNGVIKYLSTQSVYKEYLNNKNK